MRFPFCCRSETLPVMKSEIALCASSSGVRRAARRATKSLVAGSSSQAFATSSMGGPDQTAAAEISGTLICMHGQSAKRGSAAIAVLRKASSMAKAVTSNQFLTRASGLAATRKQSARRIIGEDGADHEQSCASAHDCERDPVDLSVKRKTDKLDSVRERVELAHIIKRWASFPHAPQRIERGW